MPSVRNLELTKNDRDALIEETARETEGIREEDFLPGVTPHVRRRIGLFRELQDAGELDPYLEVVPNNLLVYTSGSSAHLGM